MSTITQSTSATTTTTTSSPTTTDKRVYVITGSSRGLGLEMARQLASDKNNLVFATARDPESSDALKKLVLDYPKSIELVKLDASDEKSIAEGAKIIASKTDKIDVLINNAAVLEAQPALKTPKSELINSFAINVAGPLLVTQALFPLLEASQKVKDVKLLDPKSTHVPKVVNVSSTIGSIGTGVTSKGTELAGFFQNNTSYRVSKTALNSLTVCFAAENPGIAFLTICPGWVDTDMGKKGAGGAISPLKAPESIKGFLSVVESLTLGESGSYRNYEGKTLPW